MVLINEKGQKLDLVWPQLSLIILGIPNGPTVSKCVTVNLNDQSSACEERMGNVTPVTTPVDGASCDILTTNGANLLCAIEHSNSFVRLNVDKDNTISQSVAVTATPRYAYGRLTHCVR